MDVIEYIAEINPDAIMLEGLDKCAIGTTETDEGTVLVYSYDLIIAQYMSEGMTDEDAIEFYEYNLVRALPYMGKLAPIIVNVF